MSTDGLVRLRLDIGYDGTDFAGWAVQPGRRTVAGEISAALETLLRAPVPLVVAGRTDAGVHASGQVAHIDVPPFALAALAPRHWAPATLEPASGGRAVPANAECAPFDLRAGMTGLRRRLAGLLPADVRVFAISAAPQGFDARFAALRRHYRYRVVHTDWGLPPSRRFDVLLWRRPLEIELMREAARPLVGLHDFAAYCKPREGATTVRDLESLTVSEVALAEDAVIAGPRSDGGRPQVPGSIIAIDVAADAFCHSMVRSLVAALLAVGEGRTPPTRPAELLAARQRTAETGMAPARGLTLMAVDYPGEADLAARVRQTRAVRDAIPAELRVTEPAEVTATPAQDRNDARERADSSGADH